MSLIDLENREMYISLSSVDFRKQIDGLVEIIATQFSTLPTTAVFVFLNRSRNKAKVILWHHNGFMMLYKRLERGRFHLNRIAGNHYALNERQLTWLLSGYDWEVMSGLVQPDIHYYQQ